MNELHLFAGGGGGILGGLLLGHTPICAVEIETYCRRVLLQRQRDGVLPWFPVWDDVRTFDGRPWRGIAEVVCGGFPCQDISVSGRGAGITGERSGLWKDMARIVGEVRPRYVFVENSPALVGRGLGVVLGDLAAMGFDARWGVLGADDVGAPHRRKRIWILATDTERRRLQGGVSIIGGKESEGGAEGVGAFYSSDVGECREFYAAEDASNSDGSGREEQCGTISNAQKHETPERGGWWATESGVVRMAYGVASRVDRIKALGNGQVPAVAAMAWRILNNEN